MHIVLKQKKSKTTTQKRSEKQKNRKNASEFMAFPKRWNFQCTVLEIVGDKKWPHKYKF